MKKSVEAVDRLTGEARLVLFCFVHGGCLNREEHVKTLVECCYKVDIWLYPFQAVRLLCAAWLTTTDDLSLLLLPHQLLLSERSRCRYPCPAVAKSFLPKYHSMDYHIRSCRPRSLARSRLHLDVNGDASINCTYQTLTAFISNYVVLC